jgi:hypothetical protein
MKKSAGGLAAAIFLAGLIGACGESSRPQEKVIGAIRQHDTRVIIVCQDSQGHYYEKSLHHSESVVCGKTTFRCEDLARMGEQDCYIAFPGQEGELQKYLQGKREQKIIVVSGSAKK